MDSEQFGRVAMLTNVDPPIKTVLVERFQAVLKPLVVAIDANNCILMEPLLVGVALP
jgi:hypothetical protein